MSILVYLNILVMEKGIQFILCICAIGCMAVTCKKQNDNTPVPPPNSIELVNTSHLDYLYTPITFSNGTNAAGVYIYAEAPDYHLVADSDDAPTNSSKYFIFSFFTRPCNFIFTGTHSYKVISPRSNCNLISCLSKTSG